MRVSIITCCTILMMVSGVHGQFNKKMNADDYTELTTQSIQQKNYTAAIRYAKSGLANRSGDVDLLFLLPNLYYFGSSGGGVWKTLDGGQNWQNISDGYFGGSIGAVEVAASDPNVIYAGGGEQTVRGNVSSGHGIWKTMDAGETWEHMGLDQARHIPRIRIHPHNPDIVFAAVVGDIFKYSPVRGIYKSMDGGKSWRQTLLVNNRTGAVDLIIDPVNPRILYASTWHVERKPYELSSGGDGSALWKSKDSGETWENISGHDGLPKGVWGISGITVSPVNNNRLWAIIENEDGGVFRSDDGGKTWSKMNSDRDLRQRAKLYRNHYIQL